MRIADPRDLKYLKCHNQPPPCWEHARRDLLAEVDADDDPDPVSTDVS